MSKESSICDDAGHDPPEGWARPIYVMHEHHASRLHWDLRLEFDGVLRSWAVPREPPAAVGVRRLAIMVDDHSLGYADFKGEIPEGQYGAGKVDIWDHGTFEEVEIKTSKIIVDLKGERLQGPYCLIQMKPEKEPKNWLLFKKKIS